MFETDADGGVAELVVMGFLWIGILVTLAVTLYFLVTVPVAGWWYFLGMRN